MGERELAIGMVRRTLERAGADYDMATEAARMLSAPAAEEKTVGH